jgi:hypothetical protein
MRVDASRGEKDYEDDYDASGDGGREPRDDRAYWRRRFLIVCAGVAALGACALLFPGVHQAPAGTAAATQASVAALASGQALPPAAYGSAWAPPKPTPSPTPTVSPSASPTASAKATGTATKKPPAAGRRSPSPSASGNAGVAACSPASIVLSLSPSQSSYARGAQPAFSVYAVSTSAAPCTLTYGAGSVQVVVTQHGNVVWDSATCTAAAARPVRFTLGVPQVLTLVWNPRAATPAGCAGSLPAGASGTLDAVAMSHGRSSPVRTFSVGG